MTIKTIRVLVTLLCGLLFAASAEVGLSKTLSINFHLGASPLNPAEVAGVVPDNNWNNVNYNDGAAAPNDNNGTKVGSVAAGGLVDGNGNTLTNVALRWAGNFANTDELQVGGPSSDHTMMATGIRSINRFNATTHAQLELTNLASEFPGGYDVYIYLGRGINTGSNSMGGWGMFARLPAGSFEPNHALMEGASPYNAGNPTGNFGTQLSDHGFQVQEFPNFDGNFNLTDWNPGTT